MNATDYAEATGYLRAVEKKILTTQAFERLIDASSQEEALKMLSQNSEIDFSSIERSEDYEIVLNSELKRVYSMLYNLSPSKELVDILACKYDYHNIKVCVKAFYLNEDFDRLFINVTDTQTKEIKSFLANGDDKNLEPHVIEALTAAKSIYEETKDPQMVDIVLDKLMFKHMIELSKAVDSKLISNYVYMQIDFYNAKLMLRAKGMQKDIKFLNNALSEEELATDVDIYLGNFEKPAESLAEVFSFTYFSSIMKETVDVYEKTKSFQAIEKLADNYSINSLKEAMLISFGPEPLFAYIVAKENEIKQIRMLITCKQNNIPMDTLKERLRDNYE